MIFVTVGTNEARFDRLLREVERLDLDEDFVIQHGHSSPVQVAGAQVVDFLSFEEMVETIRRARAVVTHAGVGSIMVSLANAKRPIVVPRRKTFAEAVDDHQLQLGRRFAEAGMVTLVELPENLAGALAGEHRAPAATLGGSLAADLRSYLQQAITPHPSARR